MKRQICDDCRWYTAYYTQNGLSFIKTRDGACRKTRQASERFASCAEWEHDGKKRESRQKVRLETLNEMAKNINEILQIMKEEKEKNPTE